MKRLKIMKSYVVVWLFIYFIVVSNIEAISMYFFATLTFNLAVLTVLTIGIIMVMKAAVNLVMLAGTFGTLAYKKNNLEFYLQGIESIMPPSIAYMFQTRAKKGMLVFTAEEARGVVEMIEEKFGHQNRYTNYFTGTVLMIGLLGTFSGLLIAIDDMGRIILSLSGDIDLAKVISDFSGPLGGMAVGFGSSLFGVVAAIILGLKGYILNKNQEQLINGVEDWLKSRTIDAGNSNSSASGMDGGNAEDAGKSSFMDVFIDNLTNLTVEMGKISKSNEQLHSITVASVQQAHDEHELNLEVFNDISKSLKNMDTNAVNTTTLLSKQFNSLQISINTNHQQMILQQQDSMHLLIEKIENALEIVHTNISKKFEEISQSSNKEIRSKASEITKLLNSLSSALDDKQTLLLEMQSSDKVSQKTNEDLLSNLITILKESSAKLDIESKLLDSISTKLSSNANSNDENFTSVSKMIESFSLTIQDELSTLEALHKVQEKHSTIIEESLATTKDINNTLIQSYDMNEKHETQLNNITSKIAYVSQQIHKNNSESTELLTTELHQLHEITNHSKKQESILAELLDVNKDSNQKQQGVLEEILQTSEQNQLIQEKSLAQVTQAILDKEAVFNSDDDKKSGGLFGKLFK